MQLEQRIVDNVAIIKVTGDITLSKGGDVLLKDKVQSPSPGLHQSADRFEWRVACGQCGSWRARSRRRDGEESRGATNRAEPDEAAEGSRRDEAPHGA